MFRPALNKKTNNIDLINLETEPNINDYIIIWIEQEANQDAMNINWDWALTKANNERDALLKQNIEKEQQEIKQAISKNKNAKTNK